MLSHWNVRTNILCLSLFFTLSGNVFGQIVNGNFNQPGVKACNAGTGWTTATGSSSAEYTNAVDPSTNFWIDLTPCKGWGNGTYIEQVVPTVVDKCYYLKFDLGSVCAWDKSDAGVYIAIDGNRLGNRIVNDSFDCTPDKIYWKTCTSQSFVATASTTTIRFTGEGRCTDISPKSGLYQCSPVGSIGNPGVIGLDNIELISSPGTGAPPPDASANIDTGYYCHSGSPVLLYPLGAPPLATVKWSVLSGDADITAVGDSAYVTAKEFSQILMTVTAAGTCSKPKRDTVNIIIASINAEINIIDKRTCLKDSIQFFGSFSASYSPASLNAMWYFGDGTTGNNLNEKHSYTQQGVHTVLFVVRDSSFCTVVDTAIALVNDDTTLYPPYINLGPVDTTICRGEILQLPLGITAGVKSYLWSDGSTNQQYYVDQPGIYSVNVFNNCGVSTDSIVIHYRDCSVWFPSAFSPNQDGINDRARLTGTALANITDYRLSIFNRFGNNVFKTYDPYQGWDGVYNNVPQLVGAYYYYIKYTLFGEQYTLKGDIILVR